LLINSIFQKTLDTTGPEKAAGKPYTAYGRDDIRKTEFMKPAAEKKMLARNYFLGNYILL
jgi:hypothetical protein